MENKLLFRASRMAQLMQGINTQGYIKALMNTYNESIGIKSEIITNKYFEKGLSVEGIALRRMCLEKNEERLKNDFFTGIPDYIDNKKKIFIDIKNCYHKSNFDAKKLLGLEYKEQMNVYNDLLGEDFKGYILYCLEDLPEEILNKEIRKLVYDGYEPEIVEEIVRDIYCYDLSWEDRVYIVEYIRDDKLIEKMKERVLYSRELIETIKIKDIENKELLKNIIN